MLVFVSCDSDSNSTATPSGGEVTVTCKCQSDTEFVRGKGSDKAAAEKSAQEKCSIIFPSATVKDCQAREEKGAKSRRRNRLNKNAVLFSLQPLLKTV